MICKYCGNEIYDGEKFCGSCGKAAEETPVATVRKKAPVGWILAVIVLVLGLAYSGMMLLQSRSELSEMQAQVEAQQTQIEEMRSKTESYDKICSLKNASIGHISNEFRVTKGTVVLSKHDKGKQITLTTDWLDGATISTNLEGTSASLDFDNNTWYEKTTMTIVPHHEGVTIVTFTNDLNSESFKVLLVVTE